MARIEDTIGNATYTIPNCDCGLTGGCDNCQPLRLAMQYRIFGGEVFIYPEPELPIPPALEAFYQKRGY